MLIILSMFICQCRLIPNSLSKNWRGKTLLLLKIISTSLKPIKSLLKQIIKTSIKWLLVIKTVFKNWKKPNKLSPFLVINFKSNKNKSMLKKSKSKRFSNKSKLHLKKLINFKKLLSLKRNNSMLKVLKLRLKVKKPKKSLKKQSLKFFKLKKLWVSLIQRNLQHLNLSQNLQTKSLN